MCSLTLGLMAASTGLSMYQANSQAHAQKNAYEAQAQAAAWNRAAEEKRAGNIAESYAQKQKALNDKYRIAVGNARAQAGASGLDSTGGSLSDVLGASTDAFNEDSKNLLANQRNDTWASYVKQTQYLNEQNAYNQMAHNTKRQRNMSYLGTLLSGASSMYRQGYKEGVWGGSGNSSPGSIGTVSAGPFYGVRGYYLDTSGNGINM